MITIIKDENGNEEYGDGTPLWASVVIILLVSIVIFVIITEIVQQSIAMGFVILFVILCLYGVLSEEKITFDKRIKNIIVERRTINRKLKFEWKEKKRIKFSGLKGIYVIEHYEADTEGEYFRYYTTELIINERNAIWDERTSEIANESAISLCSSNSDFKSAREFTIWLCKITGINGYYIDERKIQLCLQQHEKVFL